MAEQLNALSRLADESLIGIGAAKEASIPDEPRISYLDGLDTTNAAIEEALCGARREILTAQPDGPRPGPVLEKALESVRRHIEVGVSMRTLYQHTTRFDEATKKYVRAVTEYGFLMYRKDLFKKTGLTMPQNPTWQHVASLAAKIDGAGGANGICLRGLPGWGQNLVPINTAVNTFGGAWYDMKWNAQLTSPEFKKAVQFYVDLVRKHGEDDATRSGVFEILDTFKEGKCAMMYDATSLAQSVESFGSAVKGKVGYVPAPHDKTQKAGWLWTWAWGIQNASEKKDAAWKFISWASSKEYQEQIGKEIGWIEAPAGSRKSLYTNPDYQEAAAAWYRQEYTALTNSADPKNPGVSPRPYTGIQFVGIPEFTDLGTKVSKEISRAIDGRQSVDTALQNSEKFAQAAVEKYRTG